MYLPFGLLSLTFRFLLSLTFRVDDLRKALRVVETQLPLFRSAMIIRHHRISTVEVEILRRIARTVPIGSRS